jgi:hypothetical protein
MTAARLYPSDSGPAGSRECDAVSTIRVFDRSRHDHHNGFVLGEPWVQFRSQLCSMESACDRATAGRHHWDDHDDAIVLLDVHHVSVCRRMDCAIDVVTST